jgi:hypothetical protein
MRVYRLRVMLTFGHEDENDRNADRDHAFCGWMFADHG